MADDARFAELISKIAHELRSPLTSVKGFSATLINRWDRFTDEQRLEFVETIHRDAERMGRIVSEVLDLARLESGRLELNQTRVELGAVAAKVAQQVSELPGAERLVLDVEEDLTAWADPARLEHVIFNLVENAIKFSDDGAIELAGRRDADAVEITVRDRGVGIDDERLPTIFGGPQPATQRATPSGSGLGLYLSRRLVEAHGGTLSVDSKVGAGSTFFVRLPSPSA